MEKNIQDKDLGVITLRTTPRATRYTLKISKGKITATMPPGGDEKRMIAFIMENKPKLIKALQKHPARPLINEQTQLQATTFQTYLPDGKGKFLHALRRGNLAYRLSLGNLF